MRTLQRIRDVKIRKHTIVFLTLSMVIAFIGWIFFLIFFGRVDPIIKSTTEDYRVYHYGLITLPFWIYTFGAPLIYPLIVIYICNGHWVLGIAAQIASVTMGAILGAVLNVSSSVIHVVRHVDKNKITLDICVVGLVGILASMINLVVLQISIPIFHHLLSTKTIHVMGRHEVRPLRTQKYKQQQQQFNEFSEEESFLQELEEEPYYDTVPPYAPASRGRKKVPPPRPPPPTRNYPYEPNDGSSGY